MGLCLSSGLLVGFWWGNRSMSQSDLLSPILNPKQNQNIRLQPYTIPNLTKLDLPLSTIQLTKLVKTTDQFNSYLFVYSTLGGQVTGLTNIPAKLDTSQPIKVIVLIRGYVPPEIYEPGVGTRAAGETLAQNGYLTLAPDFLAFGQSDDEPSDVLEARFIKPAQVMNLIKNIEQIGVPVPSNPDQLTNIDLIKSDQVGIWAHSNGGQIALTALEGLGQPLPTTLWAPVTAPFPYSILYFSDEDEDEGRAARANTALFEKNYNAHDFSLTKHLDRLTGPLQLHQGTSDEAVPITWNREFRDKVLVENKRRLNVSATQTVATQTATVQTTISPPITAQTLSPINLKYFEYPGANHNLKPGWDVAMSRDLEFFKQNLAQ